MNTYCVVLRPQPPFCTIYTRPKRCYLRANSATQAMLIASEDPEWRVIGVEPAGVFALAPVSDDSGSKANLHVA
jgi:hypothetical protein